MVEEIAADIPTVYFKNDGLEINNYELCEAVADAIGEQSVVGAQRIKNLWRIYLKNEEAKLRLIAEGLEVGDSTITLSAQNPYSRPLQGDSVKITVRDLPLTHTNKDVQNLLQGLGARLTSEVKICQIRKADGKFSGYINADRYAFAEKEHLANHPLPRFAMSGLL